MKPILLACIAALALAGCVSTNGAPVNLGTVIGNALSPANIGRSLSNLERWGNATACFVSRGTAGAQKLEKLINTGQAAQTTTGLIYTISDLACQTLGGTPTAVVPAAAVAR